MTADACPSCGKDDGETKARSDASRRLRRHGLMFLVIFGTLAIALAALLLRASPSALAPEIDVTGSRARLQQESISAESKESIAGIVENLAENNRDLASALHYGILVALALAAAAAAVQFEVLAEARRLARAASPTPPDAAPRG